MQTDIHHFEPHETNLDLSSTTATASATTSFLDANITNGEARVDTTSGCIQNNVDPNKDVSKYPCTANDVRTSKVVNVTCSDGCDGTQDNYTCANGVEITFTDTYLVLTTANERYSIGLWFDTAGDNETDFAKTGDSCTVVSLATGPESDPNFNDLDGDACGDVTSDPNKPMKQNFTLTVLLMLSITTSPLRVIVK